MLDTWLYYLLLIPASFPILIIFCYTSWLGWQLFINNETSMVDLTQFSLVQQGAEARFYTGTFLGHEVMVKERFSKKYR